jgi:two-component SAPR family response regulator
MRLMYKLNSILLISYNASLLSEYTGILSDFKVANEIKVLETIENGLEYMADYGKMHDQHCPELIFLDLENMLEEGIEFLEAFSKLYVYNKESVRIVFLTSPENQKEAAILKALGDFEFIHRPLTEETFFNCLTEVVSF